VISFLFVFVEFKLIFIESCFNSYRQTQKGYFNFSSITEKSVVFEPQEPWENYGTEDPRIAYREKVHFQIPFA
jgi:hypothetical protein